VFCESTKLELPPRDSGYFGRNSSMVHGISTIPPFMPVVGGRTAPDVQPRLAGIE
jgi:hypothetical protein